eukprot:tig00001310_g8158.t1
MMLSGAAGRGEIRPVHSFVRRSPTMPKDNKKPAKHHEEEEEEEEIEGGARSDDDVSDEGMGHEISMGQDPEEFVRSLPAPVQRRVKALEKLHGEHQKLENEFKREVRELELKYAKLYQPLYDKRKGFVSGAVEPTDEEAGASLEDIEKLQISEEGKKEEKKKEEKDVKGIPDFWRTALLNHPGMAEQVSEKDLPILEHLVNIECRPLEGKKGFEIDFTFSPNAFFTETLLKKKYIMDDNEDMLLDKAEGTEITWAQGKNPTIRLMKKKIGGKGRKPAKTITKEEPCDSFFNFFKPPQIPESTEEMDEEEHHALQETVEADYEMGCCFKDQIVPHAVKWFTGEAADDYEDDDEEDEDDEDDEDGDEDEDDEDEDEDDSPPKRGGRGGRGGAAPKGPAGRGAPGAPAGQQPECKQQ